MHKHSSITVTVYYCVCSIYLECILCKNVNRHFGILSYSTHSPPERTRCSWNCVGLAFAASGLKDFKCKMTASMHWASKHAYLFKDGIFRRKTDLTHKPCLWKFVSTIWNCNHFWLSSIWVWKTHNISIVCINSPLFSLEPFALQISSKRHTVDLPYLCKLGISYALQVVNMRK